MAGIDSFTKLMLHCNGADTSTVFTDDSFSAHAVTAVGDAQIDTAQSKFGGASGLFDGGGDYLTIPDSDDFTYGTNDFTIDFWVRFSSLAGNQILYNHRFNDDNRLLMYKDVSTNRLVFVALSGGTTIALFQTQSIAFSSTGVWYHVALVRDGDDEFIFIDGDSKTLTYTVNPDSSTDYPNVNGPLEIGRNEFGNYIRGHIDEYRISNGVARWTSNFTPPTEEYSIGALTVDINETVTLSDNVEPQTNPDTIDINETIILSDDIVIETNPLLIDINETVILSDNVTTEIPITAKFASKMISVNPLYTVTNEDPAKIIETDISNPLSPISNEVVLVGAKFATDISLNTGTGFLYISCADGIVVKVDPNNLASQTLIDLSDTDNLDTISALGEFGLTFTGTENNIAELYQLDEREIQTLDSNLQVLQENQFLIGSDFESVEFQILDVNGEFLSEITQIMNSDFKCLTNVIDEIEPFKQTDFHVFINGVELSDIDIGLNTINIQKATDAKDIAEFILCRRHDDPDKDLNGVTNIITNQNPVIVKLKDKTIFTGKVSEWQPTYSINSEQIQVRALSSKITVANFNDVTLSLTSIDKRLNIYDILLENFTILNPEILEDDDDPVRFLGIRAPLGDRTVQSLARRTFFDSDGQVADAINDGSFIGIQNYTYFWTPTVTKFGNFELGQTSSITFNYIGTSLGPVSADLWSLNNAKHRRQRLFEDQITKLGEGSVTASNFDDVVDDPTAVFNQLVSNAFLTSGGIITSKFKATTEPSQLNLSISSCEESDVYDIIVLNLGYSLGSAPFQEISSRNGELHTKWHWSDEADGLYSIKDANFNYTDYVKEVVALEYEKILNINGEILPETSATINMSVDSYCYFDLNILTRINVDNTTQANVYNNNNGFPVAIKSITINSGTMQTVIQCDNLKSNQELEELEGDFPCEEDQEYIQPEVRVLVDLKTDMKTRFEVE